MTNKEKFLKLVKGKDELVMEGVKYRIVNREVLRIIQNSKINQLIKKYNNE